MVESGKYAVEARTPIGMLTMDMIFEVDGNVLNGYIDDGKDHADFTEGTINGDEFSFKAALPSPMGSGFINASVSGTYENGTIAGKVKLPFGFAKFTGKK